MVLTEPSEAIGVGLHRLTGVRKDEVVGASECAVQIPRDGTLRVSIALISAAGRWFGRLVATKLKKELVVIVFGDDVDHLVPTARPQELCSGTHIAERGRQRNPGDGRVANSSRFSRDWSWAPRSVPMKACNSSMTT